MSLLNELGSAIKAELDIKDGNLITDKATLEAAVGAKLDNVTFKTINGDAITGTGDIDITSIADSGVVLAQHTGAFSTLKLDWSTQVLKYATIKVFIFSPNGGGNACFQLIDGCNKNCSYYCSSAQSQGMNSTTVYCCMGDTCTAQQGGAYLYSCTGNKPCCAVNTELTIAAHKCCTYSSYKSNTSSSYSPNGYGAYNWMQGASSCTCNGVTGLCLLSPSATPFAGNVRITVIGYHAH